MKTKENAEDIYKILNAWLRCCRRILAFMKKVIMDIERETRRIILVEQLSRFYSIFMNNKGSDDSLKGRTFFFITFDKKIIIQITCNTILYHWHASPPINYGRLLGLFWNICNSEIMFYFEIFPAPTSFSVFFFFFFDLLLMIV